MFVRLYAGFDGQSHFEDLELPADVETVSLKAGAGITFRRAGDGQLLGSIPEEMDAEDSDKQAGNLGWHGAPVASTSSFCPAS